MIKFSNYNEIATSPQRTELLQLAGAAIESAHPRQFMRQELDFKGSILSVKGEKALDLAGKRVFVIGAGKAAGAMAAELEKIVGTDSITSGIVISNDDTACTKKIRIHPGGHPLPNNDSLRGTTQILAIKKTYALTASDTIVALISGGGSSLMCHPVRGISLDDKRELINLLVFSGMNGRDMNIIKKDLSAVKGGRLAQYFAPTPILVLVVSDVARNDVSVIASGPFVNEEISSNQSIDLLEEYGIVDKVPPAIASFLRQIAGSSPRDESGSRVRHEILVDSCSALGTISDMSKLGGIDVVMETGIDGEAREVAARICSDIRKSEIDKPTLFLYGGETTVTLPEQHGTGGRNQEFITACLDYLMRKPFSSRWRWCALAVATDGVDFIEESCGGIIDDSSLQYIRENNIDVGYYLDNHDSFHLLKRLNSNVRIGGTTGTNVADIMMVLIDPTC